MTTLILGDCLEKLKELPDNSVDSVVTDPPYGLSFMNKKWDYDVPSVDVWKECLRVLKPGGHLLSFSGSRTYHRMAVRIEDAGFEIRDQIMWIYGSGFPKGHNIGKAVDKLQGNKREVIGRKIQRVDGTTRNKKTNGSPFRDTQIVEDGDGYVDVTKPGSPDSEKWEGWGTALKPAHEPIVMARKPFKGTVVDNVLEWGTGGLNIDDCRIEYKDDIPHSIKTERDLDNATGWSQRLKRTEDWLANNTGRWPANVIFDEQPNEHWGKFFYCPKASKKDRDEGLDLQDDKILNRVNSGGLENDPKWGPTVRKNNHPTVKPTELMLYLIKLVTPKGGTVLEPFMGSGSTGKAAMRGGYDFIGIEKEEEYLNIAKARIENEYRFKTN